MYTKKIHLSKELKLIIDLLFHDKINKILANINYEKIIKILSSQLIIPAFTTKLLKIIMVNYLIENFYCI